MPRPPSQQHFNQRVVDLIGQDAIDKLHRAGMAVLDPAMVNRYHDEIDASNKRIRLTAATAMHAIGLDAVMVTIQRDARDRVSGLIVTAPEHDEQKFAALVAAELRRENALGTAKLGTAKLDTAEGYDTNDVPTHTKPVPPSTPDKPLAEPAPPGDVDENPPDSH